VVDVLHRNNVTVRGRVDGPAMVFAHGFGCDQNMWRFVAPAFRNDYRVVLFDYVGCGKSDPSAWRRERYASLEGHAQDVLDVVHALDLRDVVLVGHSVSSVIGMLAAIREPDRFARLVLVGPSMRYIDDPPDYCGGFSRADIEGLLDVMDRNYIGWASFLAPVVMKNDDRPGLAGELQQSFCSTDPTVARTFARATFLTDYRHLLDELTTPSLVMQCAEDAIAPDSVGEYIHRRLPGSRLYRMQATGHCPHMSHPDETIAAIRDYLARPPA
jgi:sigma-B regulation protein RsbQ